MPDSFSELSSLSFLQLNNNKLIALPDSFGGLGALYYAELSWNQLTSLPSSIVPLSIFLVLDDNLLPTEFESPLPNATVGHTIQDQLF